jgi:hypothetical protein
MTDPFALLRDELVHASERQVAHRVHRSPKRKGLLTGVVGLGSLAAAASALALLSGNSPTPAPANGVLPLTQASFAGDQYSISVWPAIQAGAVGWCSRLVYERRGTVVYSAGAAPGDVCAGERPPGSGAPVVGGNIQPLAPVQLGERVLYTFVATDVRRVRLENHVADVLPVSGPSLPTGIRAVVLIEGPRGPGVRIAGTTASLASDETLTAISRSGVPLAVQRNSSFAGPMQLPTDPWVPGPTSSSRCSLTIPSGSGMRFVSGASVRQILPVRNVSGRPFLSCLEANYSLAGQSVALAVLIDARNPGALPAALPGTVPVPGDPGFYDLNPGVVRADHIEAGGITGVRVTGGWLVAEAPTRTLRLAALRAATAAFS